MPGCYSFVPVNACLQKANSKSSLLCCHWNKKWETCLWESVIISSSLPHLSSGKWDLFFPPQRVSQPPIFIQPLNQKPVSVAAFCSAALQRAGTRLTPGVSGTLARQDNGWELHKRPPPYAPFSDTSESHTGGKPRLTGTSVEESPVPASSSFLQSLCSQLETSLRLRPRKFFSTCSYQFGVQPFLCFQATLVTLAESGEKNWQQHCCPGVVPQGKAQVFPLETC